MAPIKIVFEDDSFLVIDKPSGVVVNRIDTTFAGETIQDWIENKIKNLKSKIKDKYKKSNIEQEYLERSGIVHRLDKDTSGLLVIAKTPKAFENLKNQFKGREVLKKYLALVHGKVTPSEGKVKVPIGRSHFDRTHFGVSPEGREAETRYRVIQVYRLQSTDYSFLELIPHTGRTHQIRVHLKYIGHPIVSDSFYAGRKQYKKDLKFCPRLFLHAAYIQIKHPQSQQVLDFNSGLPYDLAMVLKSLTLI